MRGLMSSERATSDLRRISVGHDAGFDVMNVNHANSACVMQVPRVRQVGLTHGASLDGSAAKMRATREGRVKG